MFRNLDAEQARFGLTDSQVAEKLGISRNVYGRKKKTGNFNRAQIIVLLKLFNCNFDYLFAEDDNSKAC